jgi:tungstate transport system substrate-binding protein
MMKKNLTVVFCMLACVTLIACGTNTKTDSAKKSTTTETVTEKTTETISKKAVASKGELILATTTSTQDSGLLDVILPVFTKQTGWEVKVIAVGTGEALKMGETGDADVLLVHAKEKEEAFVKNGYGLKRFDVMYNDFVIIGPKGVINKNDDVKSTFQTIFNKQYGFVSRGDDSGTNTKELSIWTKTGLKPTDNPNYVVSGQGMGATILMAEEKAAFTLSDRATWLATKEKTSMEIVCEKDNQLLNYYGVIAVNPKINSKINATGAQDFITWILSKDTQELIGNFGVQKYGEVLFIPNAKANK